MRRNQIITVLLALAGLLPANAQYTFTLNVSWSGNCSGYTAQMNSMMGKYKSQAINGFPTRELCEQTRAMCHQELGHIELVYIDTQTGKVVKREATNCKLNVTTTPCTGRPMAGTVGTLNALGVSQGTSFYSANSANEIQNWSSDDMERMLALNPKYKYEEPSYVQTNDAQFNNALEIDISKPFRSLNVGEDGLINTHSADLSMNSLRDGFNKVEMANDFSLLANQKNVQRYVDASQGLAVPYLANPQDLVLLLHMEYKRVSGFDVDAIRQKLPSERTDAEKQALNDYLRYRKETIGKMINEIDVIIDKSKEKKEIDGAILAYDVYGTDKDNYLQYTNYERVPLNEIENSSPIKGLADAIKICNDTGNDTGIHVELYFNQKNNTYVISCAGSDDKEDWLYNNAANALGGEVPQYIMAKVIADAIGRIPEKDRTNLNIEVVGHSLGGGMASIIGLATGIETKTYNAARVPEKFLKENGLLDKVNNGDIQNISAYHTSTDILTSTQQLAGTPAIGVSIDIGDPSTIKEKAKAIVIGGVAGTVVAPGVGTFTGATIGVKGEGHRMGPMVRKTINDRIEKKKTEWDRYRKVQSSLRGDANSIEYQTQESIHIITGY